jgi:CRISPR-associated protein Cmr1
VHEVTFTLETVTPLFVAGADQQRAELRAPSFRGEMRYWLRALLGGLYGTDTDGLKKVWKEEQSVFGTTDHGSAVMIRLEVDGLGEPETFEREPAQRDARGQRQPTGRDYLFWSMAQMGRDAVKRQYYPPDRTFTLTLSLRGQDRTPLNKAVAALWLLTYLGSIGARSRRGAGSLSVTGVEGWDHTLLSFQTPATAQEFQAFLHRELHKARSLFPAPAASVPAQPPYFDVLAPTRELSRLWVVYHTPPWINFRPALEALGASMRDFRSRRPPDHDNVARWLTGRATPPTVERAVFGLPLPFRYSNGGPSGVVQSANREHEERDRRASPVLLRVAKLGGPAPQYVGVVVLFQAQFLPSDQRLVARGARPLPPPADYSLIEQWVKTFPHLLEVW